MGKQHAIARYVDANASIDVGPGGHSIEDGAGSALVEDFERLHPMGRRAEVSHIAAAAAYLASDEAEVVTGNEFMLTGGILAPVRERRLLRCLPTAGATRRGNAGRGEHCATHEKRAARGGNCRLFCRQRHRRRDARQ